MTVTLSTLDGRIHDGKITESPGGVARNIADALGKLNCHPAFLSAVGEDTSGQLLYSTVSIKHKESIQRLGDASTAQCIVILDAKGECKFLIGDMKIHEKITPAVIINNEDLIRKSPLMILDANLTVETLDTALMFAEKHNVPVFFEPTDVPVSTKPFETKHWKAVKFISPNLTELKQIADALNIHVPQQPLNKIEEATLVAELVAKYIDNVIVTLGADGLLIARRGNAADRLIPSRSSGDLQIRHYPAPRVNGLINVSGAGDCLVAGLVAAMLDGHSEEECMSVGLAAALASLQTHSAVPPTLFGRTHTSWDTRASYDVLKM